jgi:hypothetical protein
MALHIGKAHREGKAHRQVKARQGTPAKQGKASQGCDDGELGEGKQSGRHPLSCRKKIHHTTKYLSKSP